MQRHSKEVLQQLESSAEVESSVKIHGPIVARKLDEIYARYVEEGQPAPDFLGNMTRFTDALGRSRQNLAAADSRHVEQLRKVVELRQERDELIPGLYRHYSKTRQAVEQLFGKDKAFVIAGIEGPTEQKPNKLLRQAELAIQRFEQPELKLPPTDVEGFEVKPEIVASGIKAKAGRLDTVMGDLRVLRRESQESRKVKSRVLDEHKRLFVWTARTLEGFYRLAGEDELADRIRPSARRPGRRVVDVEGEESAAEESASEESPETAAEESLDSSSTA